MCGIIGYIGSKASVNLIFEGLERLEYRGYDSAGIAVYDGKKIDLVRNEGKLERLKPLLKDLSQTASVGLGHTRWATHGPPVARNAHPHVTEKIALVHNGIIENYRDLKAGLAAGGITFSSDTDSEVVLHLLASELKKNNKSPKGAVVELISQLKGAFSLGLMVPDHDESLYLVKQGSPLVIGVGDGENFFASDVSALIKHTKKVIVLKDGQFARVSPSSIDVFDFLGNPVTADVSELQWNEDAIGKAGYPTYMLKEINEQPGVISNMISRLIDPQTGKANFTELGIEDLQLDRVNNIQFVACGTAYLSCMVARYTMEPMLNLPVGVDLASEFRYRNPFVGSQSLVIAVSQSGETIDTLECVKYAKEKGAQVLAICNVRHAEIPRYSDASLFMDCGPEIGVASTKAFTAMVLSHYLVAIGMTQKLGIKDAGAYRETVEKMQHLPTYVQQLVNQAPTVQKLASNYFEFSHFLFLGRGANSAIASEGALKLKELSYIHAEGYGAGELKHGPIALVDHNMPVMTVVSRDLYYHKTIANIEEVRAREGRVIAVGPEADSQLQALCEHVLEVPQLGDEALQALLNIIPLQLFSYYMAELRGTDIDKPRNLAKSVTVE